MAAQKTGRIKVRATKLGIYGNARRRAGDVFIIRDRSQFSNRWMEEVPASTPLSHTSSAEALRREHQALMGGDGPTATAADAPDDDAPTGARNVLGH